VEPEDVVHVLRNMVEAVRPGGLVLDLQVIRPNPRAEAGGVLVCEFDGEPLFVQADAATAAVDALVAGGRLAEEAVDHHDVLQHYASGPDLLDDWAEKERRPIGDGAARLRATREPCVVRERCRLRRLRLLSGDGSTDADRVHPGRG
jgi:hypothetical protein